MKTVTQCLQVSDIEALLAGDAATGQSELWEEHLSSCDRCRVAMAGRIGDQQWWHEAEQSLQSADLAEGREPSDDTPDGSRRTANDSTDEHETTDELLKLLGPTDDPRMLGRLGAYEVLGVLGRGGMGIVFKAFDAPLNRYVAIKMLLPHLAASGAARKRFEREGQAAAAVIDDHVLPIYAVSKWQNIPYLVMQYSSGNNLQRRIDADGPLDVKEILRIGMQTARGLAAAHAQGLVHRDVKPSNMLLDGTVERVMLTDFGLARAVDDASITRTGTIAGTPQYMSPEQARGKSVDARSDLFGLGGVLYAMCTGRPPFRAENSYAVLRLITDEEPSPIREINADIPDWLCSIIGKLMSKKADERYQNAEEVAELLEQCLAHVQQPTTTPLPESVAELAKSSAPHGDKPDTESRGGFRYPPFIKLIAAAAFAFSLILAGVLIVLELNKGTLKIESEADDVPIRVIQGENIVRSFTVNKSGETIRVAAGQYVIEVGGDLSGIKIQDGSVSLARGATEVVKITVAETTESPEHDVHDTDVQGTSEDHEYLVWEDDGRVRLSHWLAKAVRVDDETLKSINQLLSETWTKYIELESQHTTLTPNRGRLIADISEFSDVRQQLESDFWKRLDEVVSAEQRARLHAISTARGDGNGDDAWPYRPKAFPSVIGWHEKRFPVRVELWTKGTWFYWRVSDGKYTSSGDGQKLPAELQHFWTLGNPEKLKNVNYPVAADVESSRPFSHFIRRTAVDNQARIHGESAANQQLVLQVQESKHNKALSWNKETKAGPFTVIVTRTSVPTGPGTSAPGFTYQIVHDETGGGGTTNVACSATDPLPNAAIHFEMVKPEERELRGPSPINTLRIATLKYADGTEAPVTLKIRATGKQIATVLGEPIYEGDMQPHLDDKDNLIRLFTNPLMGHYCMQQGIDRDRELEERIQDPDIRVGAQMFVSRWELHRHLYEKYGGRVVLDAFGPFPVDGYRKWLEERQQVGDFAITDPELQAKFDALMNVPEDTRYASPDQIKKVFDPAHTERIIESYAKFPAGAYSSLDDRAYADSSNSEAYSGVGGEPKMRVSGEAAPAEASLDESIAQAHRDLIRLRKLVANGEVSPSVITKHEATLENLIQRRSDMGEDAQTKTTEVVPESTQWSKAVQGLRLGVRFGDSERGQAQRLTPGDVGRLQIYLQNASDKAFRTGFEPTDACQALFQISSQDGNVIMHNGGSESEQHVVPAPLSANHRELNPSEVRLLNADPAGTKTQSPANQLRLDDIAKFVIVDSDQTSNSFPRQYRLPPGKYFVSVTLEIYREQNSFTMTSDRLPFEVVAAKLQKESHPQTTSDREDPFAVPVK